MSEFDEARAIPSALNVPAKQQNNMCCCVLLAMINVLENIPWKKATNDWIRIHDVMMVIVSGLLAVFFTLIIIVSCKMLSFLKNLSPLTNKWICSNAPILKNS